MPTRPHRLCLAVAMALMIGFGAAPALAQSQTGLPLPRFVSLRPNEVNLRAGPGEQYPIEWVYVRAGLPVEVVDEFDNWRRIRDFEGVEGWVFHSLLSGQRNVMVRGEDVLQLMEEPVDTARTVALVEPGVLGGLEHCPAAESEIGAWCFVDLDGRRGWMPRGALYGVYPFEEVE